MAVEVNTGNLLEAEEQYIVHQVNCVTNKAAHLAAFVFAKFPHADIYRSRKAGEFGVPGTIVVRGDGNSERLVINSLSQYYPGSPRFPASAKDGYAARLGYFRSCLKAIEKLPGLTSIAFPVGIGCGAAGGDWKQYRAEIDAFAERVKIPVTLYQLGDK